MFQNQMVVNLRSSVCLKWFFKHGQSVLCIQKYLLQVQGIIEPDPVRLSTYLNEILLGHAKHVRSGKLGENIQIFIETINRQPMNSLISVGELRQLVAVVILKINFKMLEIVPYVLQMINLITTFLLRFLGFSLHFEQFSQCKPRIEAWFAMEQSIIKKRKKTTFHKKCR